MTPLDWKNLNAAMSGFASILTLAAGIACVVKGWCLGQSHDLYWLHIAVGMGLFMLIARTKSPVKEECQSCST